MTPAGLPHSEIPGSKRACRSPRLIAACCVLRRLSVPRHPPSTLSNLTIKCLDLMRSAVPISFDIVVHLFLQPVFNCQRTIRSRRSALGATGLVSLPATVDARGRFCGRSGSRWRRRRSHSLVELIGIEPTTPCLQSRCSPI